MLERLLASPGDIALEHRSRTGPTEDSSRRSWLVAITGIAAFLYVMRAETILADPDSYWHIATGRLIATSLSVPTRDPFSHTAFGKDWVPFEWLSQVAFGAIDGLGGWNAVWLLCICSAGAAICLLARHLVCYFSGIHALLISVLAVLLSLPHLLARPHVLAWPVMILWIATLVRAVDRDGPPPWWLIPVATLWANLHGSFVLGLAFMGLLALEAVANAWRAPNRSDVVRSWGVFGGLAVAASLVTPQGFANIVHILSVQGQPVQMGVIGEWQSPNFHEFQPLAVWVGVFLFTALTLGLRVPFFRVGALLVLLLLAVRHVRHVELVGFLAPLFLSASLSKALAPRAAGPFAGFPLGERAAVALGTASLLFVLGSAAWGEWAPPRQFAPVAAMNALGAERPLGKVLNDYDFGGFLIGRGIPTFIDGRSDLFGDKFLSEYVSTTMTAQGVDTLGAYLDKYDVAWTLLQPKRAAVRTLDRLPGWRRLYADDIAVVHVRERPGEAARQN